MKARIGRIVSTLIVAPTVVALALVATPAQARTHVERDAARDIVSMDANSTGAPDRPAPRRREGDVRSLRTVHGPHRIHVTLRSDRLARVKQTWGVHIFRFRTSNGRSADLTMLVSDGRWQGERSWTIDDHERRCRGLHTRVNYQRDTVTAVIPRRCLGNPRWVRVGGGTGLLHAGRLYADDATLDGKVHEDDVRLGPRVRRG